MVHGFHSYINFPEGKPWQAVLRVLKYRGESWAVLIIIVLIQPVMKYTEVNPRINHSPHNCLLVGISL